MCAEALRPGRRLRTLRSLAAEATGLLALLMRHESRRAARTDAQGGLVPLEEQDRARWDGGLIAEAGALLDEAVAARRTGPYRIQAAVALAMSRSIDEGLAWIDRIDRSGAIELRGNPRERGCLMRRLAHLSSA